MRRHALIGSLRRANQLQDFPAELRILGTDTRIRRVMIVPDELHDTRHLGVTGRQFMDEIGE